ncbi:MAG: TetR/AcrR family transcriptional regulator [Gammaproteobacteria bacterium]
MRYPADHKAATRERILATAARLFRTHGYAAVGIERLMQEAGLTRGGFYNHFASKAAVLEAVLEGRHGLLEKLRARRGEAPEALREEALTILSAYVDPANRDEILRGCSLAALAAECRRADPAVQLAYARVLRALAAELGRGQPPPRADEGAALAVLMLCIGAVNLGGAAAADAPLAAQLADQARQAAVRWLGFGLAGD